ncbi:class I SAM-dependent methyltransferase [Paenibacillus albiflavus]|uniref:Class I SAM-dependent methyltransferase n=1 Tax=Paenibacillus albiflavus TaxID=2545760 RepID=A0A4R4EE42_9BACL|nr:class I SAM-dependent methyltransferase [Paenibacillus albiflavus]TCZ78284.1 class I SAM-dependent methyltransferase [Paenibacillus albiflavus]
MNPSTNYLFDAIASNYDRQRKLLIPCFDEFYEMAAALAETDNPAPRILDLGAGTGLLSSMVLRKYPKAQLTLADCSSESLEGARLRFDQNPNINFIVTNYATHPFTGPYDMVISSLSIHQLTHPGKKQLFERIHQLLTDDGVFINADLILGNSAYSDAYSYRRWITHVNQGILTEAEIDKVMKWLELSVGAKHADYIRWMKQAGFEDADCMYKYLNFAVFFGRKIVKGS